MFDENIRIQLLVKYTCYSNPYASVTNTVKLWSFYISMKCFVVHCLCMPCTACGILILCCFHDVLGSLISCGFLKVVWTSVFSLRSTHTHTHARTHIHTRIRTCTHKHTQAHTHTHTHTHIHAHIHIHTHTYTYTPRWTPLNQMWLPTQNKISRDELP